MRYLWPLLICLCVCAASLFADCPVGDLDGDCEVGFGDVEQLALEWLNSNCEMPECAEDLDGSPGVNGGDFAMLADNWGLVGTVTLTINEFMADNVSTIRDPDDAGGSFEDWVEIHNYGSSAINIGGMWLSDDADDPQGWRVPDNVPSVTTIPAGGYLLIWTDGDLSEGPLHASFSLRAGGDEDVALFDWDHKLIDSISFGPQNADESVGRLPNGTGAWQVFTSATPGTRNMGEPVKVVINEIMYHPGHPEPGVENLGQEYIELYNAGSKAVNLTGWRFSDGVDYTFTGLRIIGAGQYLVVAADVNEFRLKYPTVGNVIGGWLGRLSNSGERIELMDSTGVIIDRVRYADQGEWAQRELSPEQSGHRGWQWSDAHDGGDGSSWNGSSLELINADFTNEYGQAWTASSSTTMIDPDDANNVIEISIGSPGVVNTAAANDIAPLILDVEHWPIIPAPNDSVAVTAEILDDKDSNPTVRLRYRVDSSHYEDGDENVYPTYESSDYNDVAMFDDGIHGDGAAGDGVYGAIIPPHEDSTIIEFFVEASDTVANTRTWPAPSNAFGVAEQVTNALYQVDASFDGVWTPGDQPIYYLIMTHAEESRILDIGDSGGEASSDAEMNTMFVSVDGVDIKCRYNCGLRNRGHGSRTRQPNNYRVNFPGDNDWKGVTAVNLNTQNTHVQLAGSVAFSMAGLAQPGATAVQVRLNGTDRARNDSSMYGSYVANEVINGEFVDSHFADDSDGNAYKCMRDAGAADLSYLGENANSYRRSYLKRTNGAQDDFSDLMALTFSLSNNISDANYVQQVYDSIHVERWLRFFALNTLLDNRETTLANGNGDDYYMYIGVEDPRTTLIQHDLDSVFGYGGGDAVVNGMFDAARLTSLKRLLLHPHFTPLYYAHIRDLMSTTFSDENLEPFLRNILGDYVPESAISQMATFVINRGRNFLDDIPSSLTVASNLPVVDGYRYGDSATIELSGEFDPVTGRSVLVNGQIADSNHIYGTWEISRNANGTAETLLPTGSPWKYFDQYTDLGLDWYVSVADGDWPSGDAELGYGDSAATEIGFIDTDLGTTEIERNITTYFTTSFTVDNASQYTSVALLILRDDGAVVYLNGTEIARSNMPQGSINYNTLAQENIYGTAERTFYGGDAFAGDDDFTAIDASLLHDGLNTLAVEIHQFIPESPDVSFDLELTAFAPGGDSLALAPGLNHLVVQAFDGPDGTGDEVERTHFDIWYNDGDVTQISGSLAGDTVLDAASGPWLATGDIVVPAGVTLTIEPGTTVFFEQNVELTVNGRLQAEGTVYRSIHLASEPGTSTTWAGINLTSDQDNRLSYAQVSNSSADSQSILCTNTRATIDDVIFSGTDQTVIQISDSSLVVRNCLFPSTTSQVISGQRFLASDPYLIFENNIFGPCTGPKQDVLNFSSNGSTVRPVFTGNIFFGGGDDALDLDGTNAYIEGNIFMDFHRNFDPSEGESYAVSTGYNGPHSSNHVVIKNIFLNCDNAVLVKDRSWVDFHNNAVINCSGSAISFDEPAEAGIDPGRGAHIEGTIFYGTATPLANFYVNDPQWGTTDITVNNCLIPSQWHALGVGNIDADPLFVNPNGDFQLKADSPARNTGPCGLDMGPYVPSGAAICGEPSVITHQTTAVLTVGGPGIEQYRRSVNLPDGPFGPARPASIPIILNGLSSGSSYTVYVLGKNAAGVWQDSPTASRTWTVDTSYSKLVINEVLAHTHGADPDIIELYYDGPGPINLTGMSLSDDPGDPRKFIFTGSTVSSVSMNPGDYMVLYGDLDTHLKNHIGFALSAEGEVLSLYDIAGQVIDSIEFGLQINDFTIGRIGPDEGWVLCEPTWGLANKIAALGDTTTLKINEWLADGQLMFADDFIELYNPFAAPVDLSGLYITDDPVADQRKHQMAPLSFIAPSGYSVLIADESNRPGSVNFRLSSDGEMLALLDESLNEIDKIMFGPQTTDVSQGRIPDGSQSLAFLDLPTPGVANSRIEITVDATTLVPENADKWAHVPMDESLADTWRTDPDLNISSWRSCTGNPGGIGFDTSPDYHQYISCDVQPEMYGINATCYIRIPFDMNLQIADIDTLILRMKYDDGFIAYLNGVEIDRKQFTGDPVWYSDADTSHTDSLAVVFEDIDVSDHIGLLQNGENLLAIHGMNSTSGSGDFLISTELVAVSEGSQDDYPYNEDLKVLDGLRVTEIMYHDPVGSEFDFIELQNVSDVTIDISGVRFLEGVVFEFPSMQLDPGEYTVVAASTADFTARYGAVANLAGQYTGGLSNGGEDIVLILAWPLDAAVMRFSYKDTWYPTTDGSGHSLTVVDPTAPPLDWDYPANYAAATPTPGMP